MDGIEGRNTGELKRGEKLLSRTSALNGKPQPAGFGAGDHLSSAWPFGKHLCSNRRLSPMLSTPVRKNTSFRRLLSSQGRGYLTSLIGTQGHHG